MELLIIAGVDISHFRLVDLTRLADQAKAFYDWVESQFQIVLSRKDALDTLLKTCGEDEIMLGITMCFQAGKNPDLPFLFDGVGRTYTHSRACYYFFSWLIRDAPQQRLAPLIQRIVKNSGKTRTEVEIIVLTALIYKYRSNVKTFTWEAVREVIIDRLEGSRRSLKGHEKEAVVRTAFLVAIQSYFNQHQGYGVYAGIEISEGQLKIGNKSYDVSISLMDTDGKVLRRILVPIKTRETEGGGHSRLFSRDITSAINAARHSSPEDYLAVIIVAKNWSQHEAERLSQIVDHLAVFTLDPGDFATFSEHEQERLNDFILAVFNGTVLPKSL